MWALHYVFMTNKILLNSGFYFSAEICSVIGSSPTPPARWEEPEPLPAFFERDLAAFFRFARRACACGYVIPAARKKTRASLGFHVCNVERLKGPGN